MNEKEPRSIVPGDDEFPNTLSNIDAPVRQLWVLGGRLDELGPPVAMIGARGPTSYGLDVAHKLAGELALLGICIVSGMARGIDAAAHEGALAVGGKTIAVLGTGVDRPYPIVNRPLYERIVDDGAVISEQPLGGQGFKSNFIARNRIIAALGLGTILVQSRGERSGAMVTIRKCADYGRDVLAVPGDVRSELSSGPHQLIREGAALCASAADVLEVLAPRLEEAGMSQFGSLEKRILGSLKDRPSGAEGVALLLGEDPIAVARALGRLELAGAVLRELGVFRRA
ncbi:MAG TPA: DNA-processing protein DprA [Actinomycetota bacterium]|nr:DNA-processing protein DprA [Actinomycetota bacterium]